MRVATLFKRVLRLGRGPVVGIELVEDNGHEQVVVEVALGDRRVMRCSGRAMRVRTAYDTRQGTWRHFDLGRIRYLIRCQVRRLECQACGVRNEAVQWARAGSRFTRPFQDTCVWMVRAAPNSAVASLMCVDWHKVGRMIERVAADHVAQRAGDGLDGLTRTGIDAVAYGKGHRYLNCVSDHDSGDLVWAATGRS